MLKLNAVCWSPVSMGECLCCTIFEIQQHENMSHVSPSSTFMLSLILSSNLCANCWFVYCVMKYRKISALNWHGITDTAHPYCKSLESRLQYVLQFCIIFVQVQHIKTMKSSDLSTKDFFQLTVNTLLELCTHCIDGRRIVSIEGRLLLTLDTGDKVELNILQQDVGNLSKSVKAADTNESVCRLISM